MTSERILYTRKTKKIFLITATLLIIAGLGAAWLFVPRESNVNPISVCTQEAKLCPDGSAVGRTGPNCEFAECPKEASQPVGVIACIKDADCPSAQYMCQETQGMGTACPSNDPTCEPTRSIIAGECKLKEYGQCAVDADCGAGTLCHNSMCVSPIGRQCAGSSDTSCPVDFACVQSCGSPVVRQDDPPPPYFCELVGYNRVCPICLAKDTAIDTPLGAVAVQDIQVGEQIWTVNSVGERVIGTVVKTSKTVVPPNHKMVQLVLADGHMLLVSPGHPTIDGRTVGDLVSGDMYNGSRIVSANQVLYSEDYTYDILPTLSGVEESQVKGAVSETGFYFANGILLGSTLR